METFDIAYHLIGDQSIPIYIATQAIPAQEHVFFTTCKTLSVATRLQRVLHDIKIRVIEVDPYNLESLEEVFIRCKNDACGLKIAIDATGGTKLMAIKLIQVFEREEKVEIAYIETAQVASLISLNTNVKTPLPNYLNAVDLFIKLNTDVSLSPAEEDRCPSSVEYRLSKNLWALRGRKNFRWHASEFAKIKPQTEKKQRTFDAVMEKFRSDVLLVDSIGAMAENEVNRYLAENKDAYVKMSKYFAGGWLEDYVYTIFKESKFLEKRYFNLRKNAMIQYEDDKTLTNQEIDLAFTDGIHLYLIECKSGTITQEDVQKLENITSRYGGTFGRAILCASSQVDDHILERIRNSRNIMVVEKEDIRLHLFDAIEQWKAGRFVYAKK